jgi:hypothetical protein
MLDFSFQCKTEVHHEADWANLGYNLLDQYYREPSISVTGLGPGVP